MGQQFGKRTKDRGSSGGGPGGHQHYIKTFREKRNPVTFLFDNPAEEFIEVREHWDNKNQLSYPCAVEEGAESCIGCSYPVKNEELTDDYLKENWVDDEMTMAHAKDKRAKEDSGWSVRQNSGKWLFPAVDSDGYVNIYKIGYNGWAALKEIYDELDTITDQVFTVLCSNPKDKSNTITFMPSGKEPQKPKYAVPGDAVISEALGDKYLYAYKKYVELGIYDEAGMPALAEDEHEPDGVPEGEAQDQVPEAAQRPGDPASEALAGARKAAAKKAPAKKATARQTQAPAQESDPSAPTLPKLLEGLDPESYPDGFDPFMKAQEAKPSALKFWLDNFPPDGIEYPPTAPRGVLIGLVQQAQAV
jgi:hypothetical protein